MNENMGKPQSLLHEHSRLSAAGVGSCCGGLKEWSTALLGCTIIGCFVSSSSSVVIPGVTPWLALGNFPSVFKTEGIYFSAICGSWEQKLILKK